MNAVKRINVNPSNLEALTLRLVACCLNDPFQWRIIIDLGGSSTWNYYMVDFSADGVPFENGIACTISQGGEVFDVLGDEPEYHEFHSIFEALPMISELIQENEIAYIESF